ncbi:hypothetical protein MLD38_033147 [Melastoma candidum]|uniref:Uncharacterized protein n=1 Tax=Melastoma candidum TaxID=119954 RepID=A0ACB9M7W3_9MYRT|nr:hypothetical protein MLD38_033147 [Melastoma candidum]
MLRGYFPDADPREKTLKTRKDGWAELDLGIGWTEKEPNERWEKVAAWMRDMSDDFLISRLIIKGIEVRPKHGVTPATVLKDCFGIVDE